MNRGLAAALVAATFVFSGCPDSAAPAPGLPPEPATRATGAAPVQSGVAISVVVDTSGSMEGERLDAVKKVWAGTLAPKLAAYQSALDRLDVAVVRCGGDAAVLSPVARYGPSVDGTIAGLGAGGGTPLGESMTQAYDQVVKSPRERKHIFVLTDGEANGSVAPRSVLQAMRDRGERIKVWLIGFHSSRESYRDFDELGAKVIMADDAKALEEACAQIFEDILKPESD